MDIGWAIRVNFENRLDLYPIGYTLTGMDTLSTEVASAVRSDMQAAGMSVYALSAATHIPYATLTRRLAGSPFTVAELESVGRVLDLPPWRWMAPADRRAS